MTSAAPGRPASPRGVLSFQPGEWSPPEALLLDTSVVVEAVLRAQTCQAPGQLARSAAQSPAVALCGASATP